MELGFKEEDIKFRDEVRNFIKEAYTSDMKKTLSRSKNGHADKDLHIKWQKSLYNKGWNGMNIDLNQVSIDCFKIIRKQLKGISASVITVAMAAPSAPYSGINQ